MQLNSMASELHCITWQAGPTCERLSNNKADLAVGQAQHREYVLTSGTLSMSADTRPMDAAMMSTFGTASLSARASSPSRPAAFSASTDMRMPMKNITPAGKNGQTHDDVMYSVAHTWGEPEHV